MAKNYTSTEIEAAVTKLVRDSIRRPYGTLGNRELSTSFNDLQDAAAGVFILTPNAPFYVVYLGTQRLNDFLQVEGETLESLLDAIQSTDRPVRPISNLSPLVNARVALSALESAASSRTRSFNDIASVPAFNRFIQNTDKFLGESSANVRSDGEIVQTPQEARSSLPQLVRELTEGHAELLRRVNLLSVSIEDFEGLNLGQLVASSVISNARKVLQERVEELEALEPDARNAVIRDVTLDVLAGRAAVQGFGSLITPSTFVVLSGEGSAYTDAEHPGTAAVLQSTIVGPYPVVEGANELELTMDDGTDVLTIQLQGSFIAELNGVVAEPFDIYGVGNPAPAGFSTNDQLLIEMPGFPDLAVTLTKGNGRTVEQIVADINAAITTQPLVAEPTFLPDKFTGPVKLDATGSVSDMDFVFEPSTAGDWTSLPIEEGDLVIVEDSTSANDGALYEVDVGGISATTLTCSQLSGPAPVDEAATTIRVGSPDRHIRLRISDGDELAALIARQKIRVAPVDDAAYITLGFFENQEIRSRNTTAQEIVTNVNTSFGAQVNNVARATAVAVFVEETTFFGRSEPTDPLQITLFHWRGIADYTGGTNVTFTVSSTLAGALTSIEVGDAIVLRTAGATADVGLVGSVTSVVGSTISATFGTSITASNGNTVEVGPSAPSSALFDDVLRIADEAINDGDYLAQEPGSIPLDVTIDRPLPAYQSLGGLPYFFEVRLGQYRVDFSSTSTQVDSAISADGSAASLFFSTVPSAAVGSTPYLKIPSNPRTIEEGDMVEFYETQYNVVDSSHDIVGLELDDLLIQVSPEVDSDVGTFDFSLEKTIPFARIRKLKKDNFVAFKTRLDAWLALSQNGVQYFRNLNRFINPLTSETNPTASEIGAAEAQVKDLLGILTIDGADVTGKDPDESLEAILASYQVEVVPRVDTLIDSFLQRGADRATTILLEGQFSEFFGLTQSGISYLGNVLELLREVQREDLPIRKTRRAGTGSQETLIASYEEPDAEFDLSDIQDFNEPDIPGQFTESGDGNAY